MIGQKELRELENRCIQEHAPECSATCPLHVNFRGMAGAMQSGNFTEALRLFSNTVPFYEIISRVCEHPCQTACKRVEAGGSIEISALERAAVQFGASPQPPTPLPAKSKKVAVVGSGLSGLTVAYDLARKGYPVDIFEAAEQAGGRLRSLPQHRLAAAMLDKDVARVTAMGATLHLNSPVTDLAALADNYDAIYLGIGYAHSFLADLLSGMETNPETYQTNLPKCFAGGSLLAGSLDYPFIFTMMDGRRAAVSIDRFLQKVSLTAARVNEGPYQTRLYTSLEGVTPLPAIVPADSQAGYSEAEALDEAQRCLLCECMECVKVCAYLEHYGGYPKKYIREIYNNLSIVMGTRFSNKLVNSCSLCGLCGVICPESLDMAVVCRDARQTMVEQKRMPPSAHDFALRDMAFSTSEQAAMLRHQPGRSSSQYLFFPGCQLSASSPEYVRQIYENLCHVLAPAQGPGVGVMLGCCGAPAEWAGQKDLFDTLRSDMNQAFEDAGQPELILACSSCYRTFKAAYPHMKIRSLWEVWDELGLPEGARGGAYSDTLSVHDPCASREDPHVQQAVRLLLEKLGCPFEELPLNRERTECCSYGGNMWLTHPELADTVRQRRIDYDTNTYLAYCAMCRDFYARQGKPTLHLLDLVFGQPGSVEASQPGPTLSQRHENRARLKRQLLRDLWGEEANAPMSYEHIKLIVSDQVQALLDQRLILIEDLQQVIEHAETTGKRFKNGRTGHFLAYYRPAVVTYWLEYSPTADGYRVHNAYSHRMVIEEKAKP